MPAKGSTITAEHRAKISAWIRTRWADPLWRTRRRSSSRLYRARWADPRFRAMMRRHVATNPNSGWPKWRDANAYTDRFGRAWRFRSRHERTIAEWFDARRLVWEYEPLRLRLSDGRTYRPDFWVDAGTPLGTFVEVKARGAIARYGLGTFLRAAADGYPMVLVDNL